MSTVTTLLSIASSAQKWLGTLTASRVRRDQALEQALKAILDASLRTMHYLAELRDHGRPQDREIELELSQRWSDASVYLRKIHPDLAGRCQMKAAYWTNPADWTPAQVEHSRIGIERVYNEARALLGMRGVGTSDPRRLP